jgi:hypothetical protein
MLLKAIGQLLNGYGKQLGNAQRFLDALQAIRKGCWKAIGKRSKKPTPLGKCSYWLVVMKNPGNEAVSQLNCFWQMWQFPSIFSEARHFCLINIQNVEDS